VKANIDGVDVDLGYAVDFRQFGSSEPVFHALASSGGRSRCGLGLRGSTTLRPDHALAFGRPCLRCWPELRGVAL
jgi:hypothetical protein